MRYFKEFTNRNDTMHEGNDETIHDEENYAIRNDTNETIHDEWTIQCATTILKR